MNLSALLRMPSSSLPKDRSDSRSFTDFLAGMFKEYLGALDELDDSSDACKEVKTAQPLVEALSVGVIDAVDQYLQGFPQRAYEKLRIAIEGVEKWLDPLKFSAMPGKSTKERLYRIRVEKMTTLPRRELFHVPFEKRHKVDGKRYSIPGLPALYLSGSLWACWEEMHRPDFHTIQMSRFCYSDQVNILDFGFMPSALAYLLDMSEFEIKSAQSNIICWPLIASCSIRAKIPNTPFIPEYIVPQLLLQWLRNDSRFDGLRYFSTRIRQENPYPWASMNYVFPVQKNSSEGYCQILRKKFCLTAPCAWSVLTNSDVFGSAMEPDPWPIHINEDQTVKYFNTEFFKCEHKLEGLPCKSID